jgi:hypothetical protein
MCYNKDISIYTYIIGLVSSYLLLRNDKKNLKILGCFFMIVIQMQLVEFFLWSNTKCNITNRTISNIGAFINFIQPIMLYLAIHYYNKDITKENNKIMNITIIIYIVALLLYSINLFPIGCSIVTELSSPYLQWGWFYKKYPYFITIMFPLALVILMYFGLDKPYNLYISLIIMLSFILSYIIYKKQRSFGSLWCWFAVFIPITVLVYDKYFIDIL